jgi:hypothetical protein
LELLHQADRLLAGRSLSDDGETGRHVDDLSHDRPERGVIVDGQDARASADFAARLEIAFHDSLGNTPALGMIDDGADDREGACTRVVGVAARWRATGGGAGV